MTTSRRSGPGTEPLQVADDVVDLLRRQHTLEGRHERSRLPLAHDEPELLRRSPAPELGIAEVPGAGGDARGRRTVASPLGAVARSAPDRVQALAARAAIDQSGRALRRLPVPAAAEEEKDGGEREREGAPATPHRRRLRRRPGWRGGCSRRARRAPRTRRSTRRR